MTDEYAVFRYEIKVRPEEYDVIDGDFPDYVEEYPAVPDVEVDISFQLNKDEAYERNIAIYEEERRALREEELKRSEEEERKLKEEKAALEQYYIDSGIRAAVLEAEKISNNNFFINPANWLRNKAKNFMTAIAVIGIAGAVLTTVFSGGAVKPDDYAEPEPKAAPVPFEKEGDTAVYNTTGLCWRITLTDETENSLVFKAEAINLSDEVYYFSCFDDFYISDGSRKIYCSEASKVDLLLRGAEWGDSESVTLSFNIDKEFKCTAFGYDKSNDNGFPISLEVSVEDIFN